MGQKLDDKFADKKDVKRLNDLMTLIIIVLFVGFAGVFIAATSMLVDSYRSKQASYQDLDNKINAQNEKIEELTGEISTLTKTLEANQQKTPVVDH